MKTNNHRLSLMVLVLSLNLTGCLSSPQSLVFVDKNEIGISVKGSSTSQDAGITLGYQSISLAVVPTETTNGTEARSEEPGKKDALSVLATFGARGAVGDQEAKVIRIFATGAAANKAAEKLREIPAVAR